MTSSASTDECRSAYLAKARVSTWVRLEHRVRTYSTVSSELRIEVPAEWPLAKDLLLSEESRPYILAMSCLTRPEPGQHRRWAEVRDALPTVTSAANGNGGVTVIDRTHSWVNVYRNPIDVGVWRIRSGAERWSIQLLAPSALKNSRWDEISVDPGEPGADSATPRPDRGSGTSELVWLSPTLEKKKPGGENAAARNPARDMAPDVRVSLKPSWQRSLAAQSDRLIAVGLDRAGTLLATAVTTTLLLYSARLYRRRSASPAPDQQRTLANLVAWAVALMGLAALTTTDDVINRYVERRGEGLWQDVQIVRSHAFALGAAAVLFGVARPARRFWVTAVLLAVPPVVVAAQPQWFGLYPSRYAPYEASEVALGAQGLASGCVLALTTLGLVTATWRLATEGGLLPLSRRFPGNTRVLRLRFIGPVTAVWTVAVAACWAITRESYWQQSSWLSDQAAVVYGTDHWNDLVWWAMWSVANGQDWLAGLAWMITGVAILAVLRAWRSSPQVSPLDDPADRFLLLAFFAIMVSFPGGNYLDSGIGVGLFLLLNVLAVFWATAPFSGRSILAQAFERSGRPLGASASAAARTTLLDKARTYREIHAELRRLDQGLFGDVPPKRSVLEQQLNDLHDWPVAGGPDRLPAKVSVVDGALALGPRDTWWANGSRAARLALVPAVPASVLLTWAWRIKGQAWQLTLRDEWGLPTLATAFVEWLAILVSAAFVLGALWRHLPGQRGAAKALPVAVAFSLPIGVDALVLQFTNESTGNFALVASAMLFVLTVTGIALDFDTFRGERRYWQSRLGLLLSIYQMRYYSLQVAYLIAQIIAMIAIWEFFADTVAAPKLSESR
ncbi:DUF6185 family protein [Streptomyces sp. R44]|uniref:DUF6185 family protein n=1 Tax=Streptomyces sp. R44 TaxID=3238633 RepID=A0AB39TFE1_9ACTN